MNRGENKDPMMEKMHEIAARRGGVCLSTEFENHRTRLAWRCAKGHEWETLPLNVVSGHWCPKCGRMEMAEKKKKRALQDLKKIVSDRGGILLSPDSDYVNTIGKLRFRCEKGHEWETRPAVVKGGHWCPICMTKGRKRFDVSVLHGLAAERGGLFLSAQNMGFKVKHLWQCGNGHIWDAFPWAVKRGNWCAKCARRGRPPGSRNKLKTRVQKTAVMELSVGSR